VKKGKQRLDHSVTTPVAHYPGLMSETPWVSVVIPVYRAEHSIAHAIASVTDQGVDGVEIICVDDYSPDKSANVIEALQGTLPALRLIRHSANQGPGPARNSGIEAARGDYIVFLDADDFLIDGGLRHLKQKTAMSPDLILVACEETRRGKTRPLTEGALQETLATTSLTNARDEPRILFWPPAPWSKVYRREFLLSQALRLGAGVAQDIPWSAGVTLTANTVALSDAPFYRYVTAATDSSITTTKSEKNLVRIEQVRAIREQHDISALTPTVASHLAALAAIHLIWSNRAAYRLLPDDSHEDFFHSSARELAAWLAVAEIPSGLDSQPLMSAADRTLYATALASGDWKVWRKTLERQARRKSLRRILRTKKTVGRQ